MTEESILEMLNDICQTNVDDAITFVVQSIKDTRVEDTYNGFRVMLLATFDRIEQHVKIDISTGDKMTPREIEYKFSSIFSDDKIDVMSYNLETILAEKLESILSKAELTTRMRDYYDIYILYAIYKNQIDTQVLTKALNSTATHRGTNEIFELKDELMELITESTILKEHWVRYQNKYVYAQNIEYVSVVTTMKELLELLAL